MILRVKSIEIENVKNVGLGVVEFPSYLSENANIIAIYGQNGSGKSAVIVAFRLVERLLSVNKVMTNIMPQPYNFLDFIKSDADYARVLITFEEYLEESLVKEYKYQFKINKLREFEEMLSISDQEKKENIKIEIKSNQMERVFSSNTQDKEFIKNKADLINLLVDKKMALAEGRSFIFGKVFRTLFTSNPLISISISNLKNFFTNDVFIIDNYRNSLSASNVIVPLSLDIIKDDGEKEHQEFAFFSNMSALEKRLPILEDSIKNINLVLDTIVPNIKIVLNRIKNGKNQQGEDIVQFRLDCIRDNLQFPLVLESDGVKKVISIISVLIRYYNNSNSLVIIDEFDSGVFEYLLGELVEVLKEGDGQLLFTSHNLRPLELLSYRQIYFTTTNPNKKYIKLQGIKSTNNLRDFYYRSILLGGQKEEIYQSTRSSKIRKALLNSK